MILNLVKITLILAVLTHQIINREAQDVTNHVISAKKYGFDNNTVQIDKGQVGNSQVQDKQIELSIKKTQSLSNIVVNQETSQQDIAKHPQTQQVHQKTVDNQPLAAQFHEVVVPYKVTQEDLQAKAHHTIQEQQIQIQKQKEGDQVLQEKIKPWIMNQMSQSSNYNKVGLLYQTFEFVLQPFEEYIFRWNPPIQGSLLLEVSVNQLTSKGKLINNLHLQKQEYILVQSKEINNVYQQVGKVYFQKIFSIEFNTDYRYFQFTNNIKTKILVSVQLQKKIEIVSKLNITVDDHFSVPLKKIQLIEEQIINQQKLKEHTYKWQWGFLQNHFQHESSMLGFTGLELLVIMSCTLLQLYFVKSLLDNRAIV